MSAAAASVSPSKTNYINAGITVKSWLLTLDHKRIALLYLGSISLFFAIGGFFAGLVRLELLTPAGDLMTSDQYNRSFTMHGLVMLFFFLIPSIPAVMGNFLIPIMIGAKDVAFPKLNLLSWYVFMTGATIALVAAARGGVDTGWTFYSPLSTVYSNTNVVLMVFGAFVTGFSSILTGLNFLVTIHKMRAPGMTWFKLPLFIWASYATSIINVLATPVIAITLVLLMVERAFRLGIFDPSLGGDPVLFQHLFWFYSHPVVYVMILPSMGVMSEVVSCFSRKRVFGYEFIAFSSVAIAILGFIVWGHHMFVSGQSVYAGLVFSVLTMLIAVPSAVKVYNWLATMYKGSIELSTPMIYALSFIGLFTIGGLTGLFLSTMAMDIHLHDTYFIVAHFHYVMVGGGVMGYLAAVHFWWPKMTGRMYPEWLGRFAAMLAFVGFNLTFFPQFVVGYLGMPRRYHFYPDEFQVFNVLSTAGATVLALGYILPGIYLTWSLFFGEKASANPWGAKGLEWEAADSPPVTENFDTPPVVTGDVYDYAEKHTQKEAVVV